MANILLPLLMTLGFMLATAATLDTLPTLDTLHHVASTVRNLTR